MKGGVSTSASALEQLQSMLKQKEGELANMQVCVCVRARVYLCMHMSVNAYVCTERSLSLQ